MTAFDEYLDDLVNGREPEEDFPKNECSWEELFEFCKRLIAEIVRLRRGRARHNAQQIDGVCAHPDEALVCAWCGSNDPRPPKKVEPPA